MNRHKKRKRKREREQWDSGGEGDQIAVKRREREREKREGKWTVMLVSVKRSSACSLYGGERSGKVRRERGSVRYYSKGSREIEKRGRVCY